MAARALLHINQLEGFKEWLTAEGIEHRPGRGDYQLMQIKTREGWLVIYERNVMHEHVTVPHGLIGLTRRFINSRKLSAAK